MSDGFVITAAEAASVVYSKLRMLGRPLSLSSFFTAAMSARAQKILAWILLAQSSIVLSQSSLGPIINGTVANDTYFYGLSPPVYPSPNGSGIGSWAVAYSKAKVMVNNMTIEDKVSITGGYYGSGTGCVGAIAPVEHVGFPGMCLQDAGNGVRGTDFVNGYASGLSVGASWNKELAQARGAHMAMEFRKKGVNVLLGPVVGPMGRTVTGGRNWEGFGPDPYQSGQLVGPTVIGMQSTGVITSTKHFIGNEQETNRKPSLNKDDINVQASSSNIDDKTLHELYLWPFVDALYAGSGNIMCSYNRINNSYACQNSKLLNGILKEELNFQGFVVSDWNAQQAGYASAAAGLDMMMPDPEGVFGPELVTAVQNGSLPEYRLDDMATRIIATWYQFGQDKNYPELGIGMPGSINEPHKIVNARDPASKPVLFDGAVEGHVLVKNINNALPLKNVQLLSLFGYSGNSPGRVNVGNLDWTLGSECIDLTSTLTLLLGNYSPDPPPAVGSLGTMISGGGSGGVTPAYWNSPYDALQQRAYEDGSALFWDFQSADITPQVDVASDAAIVFINAWASEGYDRPGLYDSNSDALVNNIAAVHNNTIVVIHNAGVRLVDGFVDNPNVTAIIYAHLPGQDSGRALTALLYGDENFSGKLPYTVAQNESHYGGLETPEQPEKFFEIYPQANFSEGVFIDYKHFDLYNLTPRYEFGYGLSYTTFSYSDMKITYDQPGNTGLYPTGERVQGGPADLWDSWWFVDVTVENTGEVQGHEVPQLYMGIPGEGQPVRQLRGFEKILLEAGQSTSVRFTLTRRDLSTWDVVAQKWKLQKGEYVVEVGSSSRTLPLKSSLTI